MVRLPMAGAWLPDTALALTLLLAAALWDATLGGALSGLGEALPDAGLGEVLPEAGLADGLPETALGDALRGLAEPLAEAGLGLALALTGLPLGLPDTGLLLGLPASTNGSPGYFLERGMSQDSLAVGVLFWMRFNTLTMVCH